MKVTTLPSDRVPSEILSREKEDRQAYWSCSGFISLSKFQCLASSERFCLSHSFSLPVRGGR